MNFQEAMQAMEGGKKVTRKAWFSKAYFVKEEDKVKSYQPELTAYQYDESIMLSNGWEIEKEGNYKFYDIIPFLMQGKKARYKEWPKDSYITYDPNQRYLVFYQMTPFPYAINFESFTANDWMIVEE